MKAKFVQSVHIDGHTFLLHPDGKPQVHEVPEKVQKHPHFEHYKKCGYILDVEDSAPTKQESLDERNKRLAEKLAKKDEEEESVDEAELEEPASEELKQKNWPPGKKFKR